MTIQEYFGDWSRVVDLSEANRIIKKLSTSKHVVCPEIKDVFRAFRMCPYNNLKVVIVGQDPYFNIKDMRPVATGIAFGNRIENSECSYSPSLEVLRESVIDYTVPHRIVNFDPSLEKWEEQGVLMLNSALSCEAGRPGSHMLMWRPFMISFLSNLSISQAGIVFVLMGSCAQSLEPYINKVTSYIIKVKHPSWYIRNKCRMPSDLWKDINRILIGQSGQGIKWYEEYE